MCNIHTHTRTCSFIHIDDKIYAGNINEQTEVIKRMEKCLEKRKSITDLENELPCDPNVICCDSSFG